MSNDKKDLTIVSEFIETKYNKLKIELGALRTISNSSYGKSRKGLIISNGVWQKRKDIGKLMDCIIGNPHTKNGEYLHGKPIIYDLLEEYYEYKTNLLKDK